MEYYYKHQNLSSSQHKTKEIQRTTLRNANGIRRSLESLFGRKVSLYWTRRNTFGYVFADFSIERESKHEWLIGKGEKDLFEKIKDEYFCLMLSENLDRNFQVRNVPTQSGSTLKVLTINIHHFREFLSVIRNRELTIGLFLYRFSSSNEEQLIRAWLRNYHDFQDPQKYFKYDIHGMIDVLQKYDVQQPEDLESILQLARTTQFKAGANPDLYQQQLDIFTKYVNDENTDERTLHDFLFKNPWMVDIQYIFYNKEHDKQVSVGEIDLSLFKDVFGYQRVAIIELKKSARGITKTSYRGEDKPVIIAAVGNAISQTIHYLEDAKRTQQRKKSSIQGIVIVGRRLSEKDDFILTFNQYLHGIRVMTYDDVVESARSTIDFLRHSNKPEPIPVELEEPLLSNIENEPGGVDTAFSERLTIIEDGNVQSV